jgi:protein O-mannosyl-transferase
VTENPVVQAGLTWGGVEWAFTTWHASNWHPLTWLSHMLDCEVFGLAAGPQHLVNVLFHVANSMLLALILFRLTGRLWPSAAVAALFAWHPLHVQSVAWISERKDVLSTLFEFLALLAYLKSVGIGPQPVAAVKAEGSPARVGSRRHETGPAAAFSAASSKNRKNSRKSPIRRQENDSLRIASGSAAPGRGDKMRQGGAKRCPRAAWYWLAVACFAFGLMAKPMLVTFPFVLLLLDYWPLGRRLERGWRQLAAEKWPLFLLTAASCVVTLLAQRSKAMIALTPYPAGARVANALVSYTRYLWKTVWPVNLSVVYPLPRHWPWTTVVAAAAGLASISILVWRLRQTHPHLIVGWLWFVGTLVPVIGLVQVGGQAMADRYTYVPLIGVFLAAVFEAGYWIERLRIGRVQAGIVAGVVLGGCLYATHVQLRPWEDSQALFTHALAVTTHNAVAHVNLGLSLEAQGKVERALEQYRAACRVDPGLVQAHNNLGNLLAATGNTRQALVQYRVALRLDPSAPLAHDNLGTLLAQLGQYDNAASQYAEAIRLDPNDPRPYYLWGKALLRQGRGADALARFRDALRRDPDNVQTLTYMARVLASDETPSLRNGAQAVVLAARANALTGGRQPFVLDTLAMACAEASQFREARQALQSAIALALKAGDKEAVSAMQARLRLYQMRQPYRESFAAPH